ncbi:MAG: Cupin 2 conserved barrel domain protein [Dehalococcoidales bacterium]|nr:Cupin 2 conserved barrel domain protein [Dehalococcoidales bacterium]
MENKFPRRIEKPWGFELVLAQTPTYAGKLIFIKGGQRLSLQYHKKKDESLYLYAGEAKIEIEGKDGRLVQTLAQAGYCLRILPLTKHRLEAIEDTVIFEVSTPELEDVERLEDDYGRTKPNR